MAPKIQILAPQRKWGNSKKKDFISEAFYVSKNEN